MLAAALAMTLAMPSCTLETSDNGDLDGFWHLERVDTISTDGTLDMSEKLVFWSVQMNLMNVVDRGGSKDYFLRFDHSGTTLRVYDPYINDRMSGDIKVDDVALLAPLGINELDETFDVESLSSRRMTLANGRLRLEFRKM